VTPYYQDERVTLYHGDCREIAPGLGRDFDLISDPPYGMKFDTDMTRFSGGALARRREDRGKAWQRVHGDDQPFDPSPWLQYPGVLLWGVNHFAQRLPVGTWLVWVKKPVERYGTFLSDAEVAWVKGGHGIYLRYVPWEGFIGKRDVNASSHPTQKPIEIMRWSIEKAGTGRPVLDPFAGSGTTLLAAKDMGLSAVGVEIDERHCETAARRLSQGVLDLGGAA
jgi:DNA modification methylase